MLIVWLKIIIALVAMLGLVDPAHAEPISTAIGLTAIIMSTGVAAGTAGVIGGALVMGAIGVGAAMLSRVFTKPATGEGNTATDGGVQTSLRVGADVPRNRVFGKQMLAGQLAYWNVFGPDNRWLQMVFVLGVGPHEFFGMFGDGKRLTLGPIEGGPDGAYPITDYNYGGTPLGWVKFHRGFPDQVVEGELVDAAVPPGRWSASNVGAGVCYAYVKLFYWPETFKQGIPQFQFEVGARCYDPRLDVSAGGSHVWSDQHTWQWSDNPSVILYNFERGLYVNAQRVLGRGVAPQDMIRTMYIDAANVCDEMVARKDDTSEKRYRIGINVGCDRELKSVEQDICVAMAGSLVELAGAWGPLAGAAKEVVATITDADFVTGKEIRFSQKKPRDQLINAMFGSYSDPSQNYQEVPYAPRTSSADEAADGDRFQVRRDYQQIQSQTQAQRVGEIERRDGRYQGTALGTLPFKFSFVEAGDWIRWTSTRRGFDKTFRVKTHRLSPDQMIELSLDETDAAVFDFDEDIDELDPLNPGDLPGIGALISVVPDFTVESVQIDGVGSLTIPALVALWSPITDRTVDSVVAQYRVGTDDSTAKMSPPFPPADGEGIITDGVQAGTGYQARAILYTTPARPVFWTAWVPVVSVSNHVVPSALTSTPLDEVTLAMFEAGLEDYVGKQLKQAAEVGTRVEQLIASLSTEQEAQNWLDNSARKQAELVIVNQVGAVTGGYTWRGDYVATQLYHPNDMVRMPDGKLYVTSADVQGIAPPGGPWLEQFNAAFISQQWKNYAGADGVAAQTSEEIVAQFASIDTTTGNTNLALATLTDQWYAFAGTDGATVQTSEEISAKFISIDETTGDTSESLATITEQWHVFAGPLGAVAQTSESIETRFGASVGDPEFPISVAQLMSHWDAFAGPTHATAHSESELSASIAGNTASITTNADAIATIDGKVAGTWQVTAEVTGDGRKHISGIKLYNDGTTSLFNVIASNFQISLPAIGLNAPKQVFNVGTVDGVASQLVFQGNMFVDGGVTARMVTTGQLITLEAQIGTAVINSAAIKNLAVDNIHIRGAAITVPVFDTFNGAFSTTDVVMKSISISFKGVLGSDAVIQVQATGIIAPGNNSTNWRLYIGGTQVSLNAMAQLANPFSFSAVGARAVPCTGGTQSVTVQINLQGGGENGPGPGAISNVTAGNIFACAYLR